MKIKEKIGNGYCWNGVGRGYIVVIVGEGGKMIKLVKKITSLMTGSENSWFRQGKNRVISANAAKKIQKTAYEDSSFCSTDKNMTPAYQEIVPQLDEKNEQLFRAALLNLYKIALAIKQYRAEIVDILSQKAATLPENSSLQSELTEKLLHLQKLL